MPRREKERTKDTLGQDWWATKVDEEVAAKAPKKAPAEKKPVEKTGGDDKARLAKRKELIDKLKEKRDAADWKGGKYVGDNPLIKGFQTADDKVKEASDASQKFVDDKLSKWVEEPNDSQLVREYLKPGVAALASTAEEVMVPDDMSDVSLVGLGGLGALGAKPAKKAVKELAKRRKENKEFREYLKELETKRDNIPEKDWDRSLVYDKYGANTDVGKQRPADWNLGDTEISPRTRTSQASGDFAEDLDGAKRYQAEFDKMSPKEQAKENLINQELGLAKMHNPDERFLREEAARAFKLKTEHDSGKIAKDKFKRSPEVAEEDFDRILNAMDKTVVSD